MPFTFSHPAIVLPLSKLPKNWISLTGLVIGSMTPDFEYFLRMQVKSSYSHTIDGLFWFDLPLGILLAFVFHNLVRNRLFDQLPLFLKSRFSAFRDFDWNRHFKKNWSVILISILIGAASHLFWDGFTHQTGYFVQLIPVLSKTVEIFHIQTPAFKILQHSSSLIGGLFIVFVIFKMPADKNISSNINPKYWVIFSVIAFIIVLIRILTGLSIRSYGNLIVTGISTVLISLILTSILISNPNEKQN